VGGLVYDRIDFFVRGSWYPVDDIPKALIRTVIRIRR
jgi:hypothetical protein